MGRHAHAHAVARGVRKRDKIEQEDACIRDVTRTQDGCATMSEMREVVIPHNAPLKAATHVRSTLLQSSIATLKTLGLFDRYAAQLEPAMHEVVINTIAASWLPIAAGVAHYRACDRLELSEAERLAIGEAVSDRMQGAFMETLTRAARTMGATPWLLLKRFDVLWGRLLQGGSIEVTKVGPKDLTIDIRSAILPSFEYFRWGFCGVVRSGFKCVGVRTSYIQIARWDAAQDRFVLRASWV